MSDAIPMPEKLAMMIDVLLQQQRDVSVALRTTVDAAAALVDLPPGWQYDPARRAFVPIPQPGAETVGNLSDAQGGG